MNRISRLALLAVVVLFSLPVFGDGSEEPTIVILVRHAEKVAAEVSEDPKNPHLSAPGVERSGDLARALEDAGITAIFSTDYLRTIETVEPLAKHFDLDVELYNPSNLEAFAEDLRERPGRIVISGHSNTTPALVELLGGDPGLPIVEATEYDRLYILCIEGETTTTVVLRYGEPSPR